MARKKLGIVGVGNMGGAIAQGVMSAGLFAPDEVVVSDLISEKAEALARELISLFKSDGIWTTARSFAWEVRMRIERTEGETGEPVHLSLALVEPPELLALARGGDYSDPQIEA